VFRMGDDPEESWLRKVVGKVRENAVHVYEVGSAHLSGLNVEGKVLEWDAQASSVIHGEELEAL